MNKFKKFKKISIIYKSDLTNLNIYKIILFLVKLNKKIIFHFILNKNIYNIYKNNILFKNNMLKRLLLLKGDLNFTKSFNFYKFIFNFENKKIYFSYYPEYYNLLYIYNKSIKYNKKRSIFISNKRLISQQINYSFSFFFYKNKIKSKFLIIGFFIFKNILQLFNSYNNCNINFPKWFNRYNSENKNNIVYNNYFYIYKGLKEVSKKVVKKINFFTLNNFYHLKNCLKKIFK
ncbi:hypothetical protein [Candidatus Vidania fulgoroideorum]